MLKYEYDRQIIQVNETDNGNDVEFRIHLLHEGSCLDGMKKIQKKFEENQVYTDILFYIYANHEYQVIVRRDYYEDFVLELMKQRLLQSVSWAE
ncbi:hypothetical protein P5G65_33820 [Paenibacillus chondroitinus]|uniref:Uncharacterized protein n=1 Tax=Paenibacillus chondroitinus TaxID=59842 RepID=A0ABU6DM70_9BACL|nr:MULTISPECIES: hypothetical protein [Paenibacillus]MCY9661993.1 hypothetical protein [Paenibacillus anseongense]MEB4798885.1 hypothetical protein [Paenibacillus chondroitinus]